MPDLETPAPAQPEPTPEPLTAAEQAVTTNDVPAFRAARQAERSGKPLAAAPEADQAEEADEPAEPATPAPPVRQLSKRQQQINDYERTIAEQKAELARLKTAPPTPALRSEPTPGTQPAAGPSKITYPAELAGYDAYSVAHPDDSYEDFIAARTLHLVEEQGKQAHQRDQEHRTRQERIDRRRTFDERLASDPTFDIAKLRPEVGGLRPIDSLELGEEPTALNAVAQEILLSEHPDRLLRHFDHHPEELQRLGAMPPRDLWREMGRLELRLEPETASRDSAPPPQLTKAPSPPTTLGSRPADASDPIEAAVASGDQAAFKAVRLKERLAYHR